MEDFVYFTIWCAKASGVKEFLSKVEWFLKPMCIESIFMAQKKYQKQNVILKEKSSALLNKPVFVSQDEASNIIDVVQYYWGLTFSASTNQLPNMSATKHHKCKNHQKHSNWQGCPTSRV